ncbi:NAD(P)/FAD-dependent oxidoreductase [Robertmurraya korlensis]|uniref:phytoene desaturase family protein n=1 Tax=Robertmurraya korlensis TaxID=519977 RepID=UPI00203BB137|nr:NAD(P)/FAD-dependent oxidoreductase [Robertmurraya korlensis]MCM3601828.1 NAD(P)/FAD-dependent oxidoreductase [Robertmurraya korlensis]
MRQIWDVVIIGGGLAGYIAANYLAKSDLSILILEKGNKVGGRAQTEKIKQDFFNLGPHALYKKGKAAVILEELDIKLEGGSPKLGGIVTQNSKEYLAPFNPWGLLTTSLLNWKERIEWMLILSKIHQVDTQALADQTYQQWVEKAVQSINVQSLLYVLGRLSTYCHCPEKVSAKVVVTHIKISLGGVLYLHDGWQTIIDQLHNKAVIAGVQIETHSTVKKVIPAEDHNFKVILSNNEEVLCKYVISSTGPLQLTKLLGEIEYGKLNNHLSQLTPVKGASLDISLSQLPHPQKLFALDMNDSLYYSVHSNVASLSENRKHSIVHVFKYYHPDDSIDSIKVRNELEQFLETIQPGWTDYCVTSRFLPNITVNQRLPLVGHEKYFQRSETDIPGLYIAGDWASPHYILSEGAACSGKQAAEEIIQKEKR